MTTDKTTQVAMTPAEARQALIDGNQRFCAGDLTSRKYDGEVQAGIGGQFPFAAVLSCIDSRVPAEIVFDQGIGDIFSARVAGNFVNDDILGSIEYACKVAGSKLVLVLGHSKCGAVSGACDGVELGLITGMLSRIKPAVEAVKEPTDAEQRTSGNAEFLQNVIDTNVDLNVAAVRERSEVLRDLEASGDIMIVGAVYDIATGRVDFR